MGDSTPVVFRKSSRSGGNAACVEVAAPPGRRLVRDSKLGAGSPLLSVPTAEFQALLKAIQGGEFDR